jgi:hypothetical protein
MARAPVKLASKVGSEPRAAATTGEGLCPKGGMASGAVAESGCLARCPEACTPSLAGGLTAEL